MATIRPWGGELPTSGGARPGPVSFVLPPGRRPSGNVRPVAIRIPSVQIDAEVELSTDDVLRAPSTPFVVAWYESSGRLGEPGNVVLAGSAVAADNQPAVFARLGELPAMGEIELYGEDLVLYRFAVDWNRFVDASDQEMADILGETDAEATTLITWVGQIAPGALVPLQRQIVRATRSG